MNTELTPQIVKEVVESITDMRSTGLVNRLSRLDAQSFKVSVSNGFIVCLRKGQGWQLVHFDSRGQATTAWSTNPDETTRAGAEAIKHVLQLGGISVEPIFERAVTEIEKDIQRKTYASEIGPLTAHSRRHPQGTECLIEAPKQALILRYIWERSTRTIDASKIERTSELSF